jgi:thiol-disulfide isomerase/thioredoxin
MKHRYAFILLLFAIVSTLAPEQAANAQARRIPPGGGSATTTTSSAPATAPTNGGATPAELYEEASTYAEKKFAEFNTKKLPFNPTLLERTLQEQRRLASLNATQLSMRPNLAGEDLYYLGMLYHLSENEERAIETLHRFIDDKAAKNERAQTARYIIALDLAKSNQLTEAEAALADYVAHTPRRASEHVNIEHSIAKAYRKNKQLEPAVAHAEKAFELSKTVEPTTANASLRDYWLFNAGNALVELYQDTKKPLNAAAAVLEELRRLALDDKSGRLYADVTARLANLLVDGGRKPEAVKMVEDSISQVKAAIKDAGAVQELQRKQKQLKLQGELAPEITIARWIGQSPVTLADLRGRVVLLDFWATWCGPCIAAFPHLVEWHDKYKDRGLVVIGITKYYGQAEGQTVDKDYEFGFLERFRKMYRLPYGIAVAGNDDNHRNYGVSGIPTAIIIDRHGIIRYVGTGVGGTNEQQVSETLEKLIEEQ